MTTNKKGKKAKAGFVFLGMTSDELGKELKQLYHAELEGMPLNPRKRCYLCKRVEGAESIVMQVGENGIRPGKLRVGPIEIRLGRVGSIFYHLCFECSCLLSRFPRHRESKR